MIERHSSTATRLSQRLVISLGLCSGIVHVPYKDVIDTESFDISGAFLQGLEYSELAEMSRSLGYEYRVPRKVYIKPPANVWRHFKRIAKCPKAYKTVVDWWNQVLECIRAMYGFSDAPLMFQLALLAFLISCTGAHKSVFDDNFLFWHQRVESRFLCVLLMTVHVDDRS